MCLHLLLFYLIIVVWFFFGTFLFLICSLIRIILSTFVAGITSKARRNYATSKEARKSQRTYPSSDERVGQWKQKSVIGYLSGRQTDV